MKSNIFIPKLCKVGFNVRTDTYTGKLGYIIYNDGKKWRKEPSWEGWRQKYISTEDFEAKKLIDFNNKVKNQTDHYNKYKNSTDPSISYYTKNLDPYNTIEDYLKYLKLDTLENHQFSLYKEVSDESINPIEFSNDPTEGFVLNKKAGGYSTGWNHRQTYCRVYDPRGFEFEISIPNLLYILENTSSIKGKGLEGKFVYGWEGKDLILIPEQAPEYKEMLEFTEIQDLKVSKKDLVIGGIYMTKTGSKVTYLCESPYYSSNGINEGNKLWFKSDKYNWSPIQNIEVSTIGKYLGQDEDIANLLDLLEKDTHYKPNRVLEVEYKLLDSIDIKTLLKKTNSYYSRYTSIAEEVFIKAKTKSKYTKVCLVEYNGSYTLRKGLYRDSFSGTHASINELIKEYPLYKQIKIEENGKKE